jgi:hypothetical protein
MWRGRTLRVGHAREHIFNEANGSAARINPQTPARRARLRRARPAALDSGGPRTGRAFTPLRPQRLHVPRALPVGVLARGRHGVARHPHHGDELTRVPRPVHGRARRHRRHLGWREDLGPVALEGATRLSRDAAPLLLLLLHHGRRRLAHHRQHRRRPQHRAQHAQLRSHGTPLPADTLLHADGASVPVQRQGRKLPSGSDIPRGFRRDDATARHELDTFLFPCPFRQLRVPRGRWGSPRPTPAVLSFIGCQMGRPSALASMCVRLSSGPSASRRRGIHPTSSQSSAIKVALASGGQEGSHMRISSEPYLVGVSP